MANVVRNPKAHPEAILPDLSKGDQLVTFGRDDVAFVFPLGAQWDVSHQMWRPYQAAPGTDWWPAFYPNDNMSRPTGPLCDGCHSVNYNVATKAVTEWNVGCEKCHGPGSPNGPRGARVEAHTHHKAGSAGNECVSCHMPKIEQTIADVNVRAHTFKFITPGMTEKLKAPNPCAACHAKEGAEFVVKALKSWGNVSGWRVVQ